VKPQAPPPLPQVLQQLHRAVAVARTKPACRPRQPFPEPVLVEPLEEQDLAARSLDRDPRRHHACVVHDRQRVPEHVRQLCEPALIHPLGHAIVDQQARLVAARHGMLRNELRREVIVELPRFHPAPTVPLPDMDEGAIERAKERVEQRAEAQALEGLVAKAREQVEALVAATSALEETVPTRVEEVIRAQAHPVARNLAEVRGLMNQVIRRLEGLESDLLGERNARVDDLSLLVDLTSQGWTSVDARLARMESVVARLEQNLLENRGAIVYRMEDRRPDAATS
jgi:hypothetical protein